DQPTAAQQGKGTRAGPAGARPSPPSRIDHDHLMADTQAAHAPDWEKPYAQYQPLGKELQPFPRCKPGDLVPQDLYRYGGRALSPFAAVDDVADFLEFHRRCRGMKPKVMAERQRYMRLRYDFTGKLRKDVTMPRSKPIPAGPVVRLPRGLRTWE